MSTNQKNDADEPVSLKGLILDIIQIVGTALLLTFILLIFIQPSIVSGDSMYPTLHHNDKLILWKLGTPDAGDIVVFDSHNAKNDKYVKRVIGIAGDHVEITDSVVTVNDVVLDEYYVNPAEPLISKGDVDIIVPEGEIYVLGDNRNHSNDSRSFGTVNLDDVDGKVVFNLDKTIRSIFGLES
ncbi:MAG: signal peptidase I [Lachnospiraceae bacterium]|nr:signal peptidase I [Lachnospiraceae bacterium]